MVGLALGWRHVMHAKRLGNPALQPARPRPFSFCGCYFQIRLIQDEKGKLPFRLRFGKPAAFSVLGIGNKQDLRGLASVVLWLQLSHPDVTDVRGERNGRRIDESPKHKAGLDVYLAKILLQAHQRSTITALKLRRILKPYHCSSPAWIQL